MKNVSKKFSKIMKEVNKTVKKILKMYDRSSIWLKIFVLTGWYYFF